MDEQDKATGQQTSVAYHFELIRMADWGCVAKQMAPSHPLIVRFG